MSPNSHSLRGLAYMATYVQFPSHLRPRDLSNFAPPRPFQSTIYDCVPIYILILVPISFLFLHQLHLHPESGQLWGDLHRDELDI